MKRINIGFSTKSDRQYICETVMTWEWIIVTWSAELRIGNQGLGAGATGLWRHLGLNVMCAATLPLLHTAQLAVAGIAFNKFLLEAISSNTGPDTLLASYLHTPRQEWTWLISQGFSHLWFLNWSKSQMNGCHAQSVSYCSQHLFLAPSMRSLSGELLLVVKPSCQTYLRPNFYKVDDQAAVFSCKLGS